MTTHPIQHYYYEALVAAGKRPELLCGCGCGTKITDPSPKWCDSCFPGSLAFVSWQHHNRLKAELEQAQQEQDWYEWLLYGDDK